MGWSFLDHLVQVLRDRVELLGAKQRHEVIVLQQILQRGEYEPELLFAETSLLYKQLLLLRFPPQRAHEIVTELTQLGQALREVLLRTTLRDQLGR